MAKKESAKKWLVLLVILVALSLVVDLLSLNVLYDMSGSTSAFRGELRQSASWKVDPCVQECAGQCSSFWSDWQSSCESDCYVQYGGPYYDKELNSCLRWCKWIAESDEECYQDCRGKEGGDPYLGECDY